MINLNSFKPTSIILVVTMVGLTIFTIIRLLSSPPPPTISNVPNPAQIQSRSIRSDNNGNHLIISQDPYRITYQTEYNTYLITILTSPFETYRQQAEQELLNFLAVPPSIACQLIINITTPRFANPDLAGQVFKPSFCL